MEIRDRIKMVIESHRLTAGVFADKIGVQRSNVSHVLSGRNKPSFEFLEKLIKAFPRVSAQWLITGKQQIEGVEQTFSVPETNLVQAERAPVQPISAPIIETTVEIQKKVVKTLVFYDDLTFDVYLPNAQ